MYPNREVFPNSPLALVAAEIRFSDAARLRRQETLDHIAIALEGRFPVAQPLQQTNVNIGGPAQPPEIQMTTGVQLKDVNNTASLALTAGSLTYETTAYTEFEDLVEAVVASCHAVVDSDVTPAIQRIGLRYIDEVRVPAMISDARQWSGWIDGRLIDHLSIGPENSPVTTAQGIMSYDLGEGRGLNFRFAALNQGAVVVSPTLKRTPFEPGPFFVLDFDGFDDFSGKDTTLLAPEVVGKTLEAVHSPAGATFQKSITDKARELFRGRTS